MSRLALQIQRHIYNSENVPRVRVMARLSVRVRVRVRVEAAPKLCLGGIVK